MSFSRILLFIGLAIFLISLLLPAMRGGDGILEPEISGWTVAVASLLIVRDIDQDVGASIYILSLGLGNLLLLASPYFSFRLARKTSLWIPIIMVLTTLNSVSYFFVAAGGSVLVGYFFWVLSYVAVTASIIISFTQLKAARRPIRDTR